MRVARWRKYLQDPLFKRWHNQLARGAAITADEYARVLVRLLEDWRMTPTDLIALAKSNLRKYEERLDDHITRMQEQGRSGTYLANYVKATDSWLAFNDLKRVRQLKIKDATHAKTLEKERVPTYAELRDIMNRTRSTRGRLIVVLMAWTGVRPKVLGDNTGWDGLQIRDLADFQLDQAANLVSVLRTPAFIVVRRELSKAKHKYLTLIPQEGAELIAAHLNARAGRGEVLTPDTPIIAVTPGKQGSGRPRG